MTLILKIMLSIFTIIIINFLVSLFVYKEKIEKEFYPSSVAEIYVMVSLGLTFLIICYIPFMFIWHLY